MYLACISFSSVVMIQYTDIGSVLVFILIWCGVSQEWREGMVMGAEREDKIKAVLIYYQHNWLQNKSLLFFCCYS